jgi:hypothetical protein
MPLITVSTTVITIFMGTICTTSWYAKTSLYHILSQVVPI